MKTSTQTDRMAESLARYLELAVASGRTISKEEYDMLIGMYGDIVNNAWLVDGPQLAKAAKVSTINSSNRKGHLDPEINIPVELFHAALDYHRAMRERADANPLTGWKTTVAEKLEINSRTLKSRMTLWNISDADVREYLKR